MWKDLQRAVRAVARRPAYSTGAAATLALGIAASATVFAFAHALLVRELPFAEAGRLVVIESAVGATSGNLTGREVRDIARESLLIEDLAAYYPSQYNATGGGIPEALTCIVATHNLFRVLGVRFQHGDAWPAEQDWTEQYLVALGHDVWRRRYGSDPGMVGRGVMLDGAGYTVTGILPAGFAFPTRVDMFRAVTGFNLETIRRNSVIARLRPGVTIEQARAELDGLGRQFADAHPATNRGVEFRIRSLRDSYAGSARPYLALLAAAVLLVLVIACGNVLNLALLRTTARHEEIAIRLAIGAQPRHIAAQLIGESVLLSLVAAVVGVAFAYGAVRVLRSLIALDLPPWMETRVDLPVVAFAVGLGIAAGLLIGFATCIATFRRDGNDLLRSGARRGSATAAQRRTRTLLAGAQVTLTVVVLVGAALVLQSLQRLMAVDLGLDAGDVITFRVDPPWKTYPELSDITRFYERVLERLAELPGVSHVAANQKLPLAGLRDITQTVTLEGQSVDPAGKPFVNVQAVSPAYFDVMRIRVEKGRPFSHHDRQSGQPIAIVSQSTADRFWPGRDANGHRLLLTLRTRGFGSPNTLDTWVTVVGVTANVRSVDPASPPALDVYVPLYQAYAGDAFFVLRSATAAALAPVLPGAVRDVDPDQSIFDVELMTSRIAARVWQPRAAAAVLVLFGFAAWLLSTVGVYGTVSYAVVQRTREIGVRLALGALPRDVWTLTMRQALVPVLAAATLGAAIAFGAARWLQAILFGASGANATFLIVPLLVTMAAAAACVMPARRAAQLDPLRALRHD
jgi:putative ABC transport system permease protein